MIRSHQVHESPDRPDEASTRLPQPQAPPRSYLGSFDGFVQERGTALVRTAFLLTGDHQLAEDLVQTVLAKLAPRWDHITGHGDPGPYVRQALVRTAIGWRRRRWRGESPSAHVPDTASGDPLAAVDARDALRRALLAMPARQRATVVLRFYEDLSEAEVARLLGCSTGTVKSQTAKGLARLRALLDTPSPDTTSGVDP